MKSHHFQPAWSRLSSSSWLRGVVRLVFLSVKPVWATRYLAQSSLFFLFFRLAAFAFQAAAIFSNSGVNVPVCSASLT